MTDMIAGAARRARRKLRRAQAEAEIMTRNLDPAPHGLRSPLIVSLTSYPARFKSLHLVVRSLLNQSVQADRVVLWLDEDHAPQLPDAVTALSVDVRICPRWRSYKKIIPTLMEWPDAHVVTADDDLYYGPDWLAGLVRGAGQGVVCHRAHRVIMGADALPVPYAEWDFNIRSPEQSPLIFPTGVGGVLYAPGVFHADICREDLFQSLAPTADDIWLYWMHRMADSRPAKIGKRFRITEWDGTQVQNLRAGNLGGPGNDQAIRALVGHYGFPDGKPRD